MKENLKEFLNTYMALCVLSGMFMFPIIAQGVIWENLGHKGNILLLVTVPYYFGLYKFRKSLFY